MMACDNEDKLVLKYAALEQDFDDLQAEAEDVATLLKHVKKKKQRLQAEIKFLKKRAMELRGTMGSHEARQASVRNVGQYKDSGPSGASAGRMRQKPLSTAPGRAPFRNQNDVGAVKSSSLKPAPNGFASSKKAGKRKLSWQDELSGKA